MKHQFMQIMPVCGQEFHCKNVYGTADMQRHLDEVIDITKYGDGIRSIFFAPLAVRPDDKFHTNVKI